MYWDQMLVNFEQNCMVRTIHNFQVFDKKWSTIFVSPELCSERDYVITPVDVRSKFTDMSLNEFKSVI